MQRDGAQCVSCGKPLRFMPPHGMSSVDWKVLHRPTGDHRVPRALGAATVWENLQLSCIQCNQDKGATGPEGWWPGAAARTVAASIWVRALEQPAGAR